MSTTHRDKWRAVSLPDTNCYTLRFDGSCPGNPGAMGVGYTLGLKGYEPLIRVGVQIGPGTNNVAEYMGLLWGMRTALRYGVYRLRVESDSLLVVNQYKGDWKARDGTLARLLREARMLACCFHLEPRLYHIPREDNSEADALSRQLENVAPKLPQPLDGRKLLGWQAASLNVWWHRHGVRSAAILGKVFGVQDTLVDQVVQGVTYQFATFTDHPTYGEIRHTPVDLSRPALSGCRG